MNKVFAIGDIHGERTKCEMILKYWNPDNQQLIFLGDLIDRGEDGYGVIRLAMKLKEQYGAIILRGNHEDMFLNWLDMPFAEMNLYYPQGGRETIYSFFDKEMTLTYMPDHIAHLLKTQFPEEIEFLKNLPYYFEWNSYVFVHAGVNLNLKDWKNTSPSDFNWIREPFLFGKNETDKIFIFGHTRTSLLNQDKSTDVWISPCRTKIGIDGGAVFGGQLHAIEIDDEQYTFYSLDNEHHLTTKQINIPIKAIQK